MIACAAVLLSAAGCAERESDDAAATSGIRDALGQELAFADGVDRALCSGAGCLRLLTYLQAQDRIVAVDSIELRGSPLDARPYAIANPQFTTFPLFGEFRGWDNPELIAALNPQPQVIFKILAGRGQEHAELQRKTGVPVIAIEYGDLTSHRATLNRSLRTIGTVVAQTRRAEDVIAYFDELQRDLARRTSGLPVEQRPLCYVGGIGRSGPHGLQSTDPSFTSFQFVHARNAAASGGGRPLVHATVSKEQLILWDPPTIFVDVSTMRLAGNANAVDQLRTDPAYRTLSAVRAGRVYGLFPHNSYNRNFETVFANAYFIGSVLYPDRFSDIEPMHKAEEIAEFLNGGPAFEVLNRELGGLGFARIPIE